MGGDKVIDLNVQRVRRGLPPAGPMTRLQALDDEDWGAGRALDAFILKVLLVMAAIFFAVTYAAFRVLFSGLEDLLQKLLA